MSTSHTVILGGGISGLVCAFYLRHTHTTLLEASSTPGGWIETDHTTGFHFEKGPRTFQVGKTVALLSFIEDLGMMDHVIVSKRRPYKRYLWNEGTLQKLPTSLMEFFLSPLTRGLLQAFLSEYKQPTVLEDESVFDFAKRRFGESVAKRFFAPMVKGIFGGDSRQISALACFPSLKSLEERYGSITKGMWKGRKRPKEFFSLKRSDIYSLKGGLGSLTQNIALHLEGKIQYGAKVEAVEKIGSRWRLVLADGKEMEADHVISALPLQEFIRLFEPQAPLLIEPLKKIVSVSMVIVSCGFHKAVLPVEGFGYLTVSDEEEILGVIFDSSVFPEHNRQEGETRLTVMLKDTGLSERDYRELALEGLSEHLHITAKPDVVTVKYAKNAIPQYGVHHLKEMEAFEKAFKEVAPSCSLTGNYLSGVSVNSCVERAKSVAESLVAHRMELIH